MKKVTKQTSPKHAELCPMVHAMEKIGGKWKLLLIYYLARDNTRFSALKRVLPLITAKMLTSQLRELESDGLVTRTIYPQIPPRVEYALTPTGKALLPIIDSLSQWGQAAP